MEEAVQIAAVMVDQQDHPEPFKQFIFSWAENAHLEHRNTFSTFGYSPDSGREYIVESSCLR